jgi:chloramphenicol O-acetyltransferase
MKLYQGYKLERCIEGHLAMQAHHNNCDPYPLQALLLILDQLDQAFLK